jgi:hypothetical protein
MEPPETPRLYAASGLGCGDLAGTDPYAGGAGRSAAAGTGDAKILANLARQELVDISVSRDRGSAPHLAVYVDCVVSAFAQELAALGLEIANQFEALQAEG